MSFKKILFVTGTRADFGKLKSILNHVKSHEENFELTLFVTGMHLDDEYGYTIKEIENSGFKEFIYPFMNFSRNDSMDLTLANTIIGLSNFIQKRQIDLIVIHGDRPEALSGAIVGSFNNIRVAHIEGGEVSGTIDEMIRHSVSKLSHHHFVSNSEAKKRLIKMGENPKNIFVIGNPDLDIIINNQLPDFLDVKKYYDIPFDRYGIVLFHPVTTDKEFSSNAVKFVNAVASLKENLVCIYPNNDKGSEIIKSLYKKILNNKKNIKVFPSLRFEYFLSLLKNAQFILGNSSAGIHEAPYLSIPSVNVGTRQDGRAKQENIINVSYNTQDIAEAVSSCQSKTFKYKKEFGEGNSGEKFIQTITQDKFWEVDSQKKLHGY